MIHESAYYWANLTLRTRAFGHCYVHAAARKVPQPFTAALPDGGRVQFTFCGWGRSLQGGGHKYKVHCTWPATGKPVPTKTLLPLARP